ncbi:hypothetical protein [Pseudomonas sp. RIT-PI-S]|uniref:hypothetical protein n=1 Tax=Pseudomonas sp. RIT-PI-S TaxID=3035295 RepID=UPI0021D7F6FE|nr:hypothetical protein [Pseudomonas sp. RIT-PI-S]
MVAKERVIEFPVPSWNIPFSIIPENAFCICYQSDVDGNGYGPYGFNTELAIALIAKRFKSVYRYSEENFQISPVENITAQGFYFSEISKALEFELSEYARNLKKN